MNGYDLSRDFFAFKFENTNKIKANHTELYFYIIDLWNRLGQKKDFGLPTSVTMECLGIGSYNTYKKTLNDLIEFGFIILISDSKNQYQSKVIAISNFDKALDKALDKATIKALDKAPDKALDSIDKQINNITNKQIKNITASPKIFSFYNSLIDYGFDKNLVSDWIKVRKTKKATNTETGFKNFISEIEKRTCNLNEILEFIIVKNWSGFKWTWYDTEILTNNSNKNGKSNITDTEQFKQIVEGIRSTGVYR